MIRICTAGQASYDGGFAVVISIDGEEAAKRTFNPHLGVEGVCVLGTSGIVEPMSQQALLDSLQLEIHRGRLRSRRLDTGPRQLMALDHLAEKS